MRKNVPYNTENPSAEELLAFLKGSMNVSDTQKMEQGMENDPLLADALSGLREMKSPEKLLSIENTLQTKISQELLAKPTISKTATKKIWQFQPAYYAAVASVALFLGFSYFFYNQTNQAKEIFENTYKPAVVSPEMTDTYKPENAQEEAKTAKITEDLAVVEQEARTKSEVLPEMPKGKENKTQTTTFDFAPTKTEDKIAETPVSAAKPKPSDKADMEALKDRFEKTTQPVTSAPAAAPVPLPIASNEYMKKEAKQNDAKISVPSKHLPAPPSSNNISNLNVPSMSKAQEKESVEKNDYAVKEIKGISKNPLTRTKKMTAPKQQKAESATADEAEDVGMNADEVKTPPAPDSKVNDIYLEGISKYEAKDYTGALEMFQKIPKNHSYRTNADFFSANCYLSLKKQQEAIHLLKPLSEKNNWNYQAEAKWYLGMAYLANGQKKKAEEVLTKLLGEGGGARKAEIEKVLKEMGATTK